ncbi:large subunit ribosomal protein L35, partial [Phenoliferia sp. Uapishka_3]
MSFLFSRLPSLLRSSALPIPLPLRAPTNPFSSSAPAALLRKPTKTKLKTHKGAAKRWLALSHGNFKRVRPPHVLLRQATDELRIHSKKQERLGEPAFARPIEKKLLRRLLPYA